MTDDLAIRFYEGVTGANANSYDDPASDTVSVTASDKFRADIAALQRLI